MFQMNVGVVPYILSHYYLFSENVKTILYLYDLFIYIYIIKCILIDAFIINAFIHIF